MMVVQEPPSIAIVRCSSYIDKFESRRSHPCCSDHGMCFQILTNGWGDVQVMTECQKAISWLQEKEAAQNALRKTDEPVLVCVDIKKKEETLTRFANPIVTRPPPPPPKKVWHPF